MLKHIDAGVLNVAYHEYGEHHSRCVILLHGFPYDAHAYDDVAALLVAQSFRVIVPYLRGFGPTRFLADNTQRSGQQAALGVDLIALMDALHIERATLAGYDWGGRAACVVAALFPNRVNALVTGGGYNIQHIASAMNPDTPEAEWRYWYQYYFHTARGQAGLQQHRGQLLRLLWQHWSPFWAFDEAVFQQTASSFENADFVEVVIHSYRHRFGLVAGDPAYDDIEQQLAADPVIRVPTIAIEGDGDGVTPVGCYNDGDHLFVGPFQRRVVAKAGHNLPQEAPQAFVDAVLAVGAIA